MSSINKYKPEHNDIKNVLKYLYETDRLENINELLIDYNIIKKKNVFDKLKLLIEFNCYHDILIEKNHGEYIMKYGKKPDFNLDIYYHNKDYNIIEILLYYDIITSIGYFVNEYMDDDEIIKLYFSSTIFNYDDQEKFYDIFTCRKYVDGMKSGISELPIIIKFYKNLDIDYKCILNLEDVKNTSKKISENYCKYILNLTYDELPLSYFIMCRLNESSFMSNILTFLSKSIIPSLISFINRILSKENYSDNIEDKMEDKIKNIINNDKDICIDNINSILSFFDITIKKSKERNTNDLKSENIFSSIKEYILNSKTNDVYSFDTIEYDEHFIKLPDKYHNYYLYECECGEEEPDIYYKTEMNVINKIYSSITDKDKDINDILDNYHFSWIIFFRLLEGFDRNNKKNNKRGCDYPYHNGNYNDYYCYMKNIVEQVEQVLNINNILQLKNILSINKIFNISFITYIYINKKESLLKNLEINIEKYLIENDIDTMIIINKIIIKLLDNIEKESNNSNLLEILYKFIDDAKVKVIDDKFIDGYCYRSSPYDKKNYKHKNLYIFILKLKCYVSNYNYNYSSYDKELLGEKFNDDNYVPDKIDLLMFKKLVTNYNFKVEINNNRYNFLVAKYKNIMYNDRSNMILYRKLQRSK